MTFQIRYQLKGKVILCPEAIHYFMNKDQLSIKRFVSNFLVRQLIMDHTILFLRVIWIAAIFVLIPLGYSPQIVLLSSLVLYFLYVFICILNFVNIQYYLRFFPSDRKYYLSKFYVILTLPLYYMLCSSIQFIGIVNSMTESAAWKVDSFSDELVTIKNIFKGDLRRVFNRHHEEYRLTVFFNATHMVTIDGKSSSKHPYTFEVTCYIQTKGFIAFEFIENKINQILNQLND